MVHIDFDKAPQIKPHRFSPESVSSFLAGSARRYRRILLPLNVGNLRENDLGPALDAARLTSAELILLIVRPPAVRKKYVPDYESLFTALKGLQAQLQSCRVCVRFDSVTGPAAASIVDYAHKNNVDLIVMAGEEVNAEAGDDVAQAVLNEAQCLTFIIPEN